MKNRQLDLKVRQEVVIADINDSLRYLRNTEGVSLNNIGKWTNKGTVIKLGRKLVTVKVGNREYKYDKEYNYEETYKVGRADSRLYLSIDEIKEEWECNSIYQYIKNKFAIYENNEFTLDQLKRIKEIVGESEE